MPSSSIWSVELNRHRLNKQSISTRCLRAAAAQSIFVKISPLLVCQRVRFRLKNLPYSPTTTTRSNRGLELSPRMRSPKNAKPAAAIAMRAPHTKLQIEYEHIRRHPMPALQVASLPFCAACLCA